MSDMSLYVPAWETDSGPAAAVDIVGDKPGQFGWWPTGSTTSARVLGRRLARQVAPCKVTIQGRGGMPVESWRVDADGEISEHEKWSERKGEWVPVRS